MRRPLFTKLLERIPQTVVLRTGLRVRLRGRVDAKHFWSVFTSPDYLSFLPHLASIDERALRVIDCGAGIGLFSLLIEHLRRAALLPWEVASYVLVEPSRRNLPRLKRNLASNVPEDRYRVLEGLVGRRGGDAEFYDRRWRPWASSIFHDSAARGVRGRKPFVDLVEFLAMGPCLLKADIEGAEFLLLESYRGELANVRALVIEWHTEHGDPDAGDARLRSAGLRRVSRRHEGPTRIVDLYVR